MYLFPQYGFYIDVSERDLATLTDKCFFLSLR